MKQRLAVCVLMAVCAGVWLNAQEPWKVRPASFGGMWTVEVSGQSSALSLSLVIEGSTVKGTMKGAAIAGEYRDGVVTFADTASWEAFRAGTIGAEDSPDMSSTIYSARLIPEGLLVGTAQVYIRGYGSSFSKRMEWTGRRGSNGRV